MIVKRVNAGDAVEARAELLACCASRRWAARVVAGRPYADLDALRAMSARVFEELAWADLLEAVSAHPRIGERPAGPEAGWSRQEQAAAAGADDDVLARLRAGNAEYERRFGHVFLICATGLSAAEVLAALRERMGNDADVEQEVVRAELRKIADLRLVKAAGGCPG
ncbi:2-oxo-4-hydroxy-4-carboxy-5-ureidoimidazoline decarboxylase [Actinokineospora sp. UTMC 2448]|uniref:2-oxo-4-hydroxy-4-carboxy-5-ureidoimidazoline decarboxylase n=1 Tax=Actinokineospora sp. UTMC 2448 TaxID=2268449 RepID=UPI00216417FD|nr:2-oxo-4-hydroxy-4-carboxy-5-ureidoimidazoline decarboxylase [Actinokineospora sp. UTMC 2448]UVS78092.1 Uric acid degradation bifunctional protein [Actinokineospora sp. UTMC 2448]